MVLKRLGYRLQVASSAQEALRVADDQREKIDLLMTDVKMQDMSGYELAEALQSRNASLKVLFMRGQSIADRRIVRPGWAFLQKPFTIDAVSKKLGEVLNS